MSGATARRVQNVRLAGGDRAFVAGFETAYEVVGIHALKLALEEPVQFGIPRRVLAVRYAERVGLPKTICKMRGSLTGSRDIVTNAIARLLRKDLGQLDHSLGVEFLGKVHHRVRVILLVTITSTSKKGVKCVDSYGVALASTPRGILTTAR